MSPKTPSYRHHNPSGQAVVTIDGRDLYLGKYGTPESRAEYDRLISEWLQNGRMLPAGTDLTINEMLVRYIGHCDEYYRRSDGTPTGEAEAIRLSLLPLKHLYGHTLARNFGPRGLKACREAMIDAGLCRNECNKRTQRIVRAFKWAAENELVPASVWHALRAVDGLKKGRSRARETAPVKPVLDEHIAAVLPHVLPPVAAMIQVQRLTGMRPGEVVTMCSGDLDRTGCVWMYRPGQHKTQHHGHERVIAIGPRAQQILAAWMKDDPRPLCSRREKRWSRCVRKCGENAKPGSSRHSVIGVRNNLGGSPGSGIQLTAITRQSVGPARKLASRHGIRTSCDILAVRNSAASITSTLRVSPWGSVLHRLLKFAPCSTPP